MSSGVTLQRRTYKVKAWEDTEDFLTQLAKQSGRLLRGGEPDLNTTAKGMLYDWQRGKIPYFTLPPDYEVRDAVEPAECAADDAPEVPLTRVFAPRKPLNLWRAFLLLEGYWRRRSAMCTTFWLHPVFKQRRHICVTCKFALPVVSQPCGISTLFRYLDPVVSQPCSGNRRQATA